MRRRLLTVLILLGVVSCSPDVEAFADRFVTPEERRFSVEYLELLQSGDIDRAHELLVSDLRGPEAHTQLEAVGRALAGVPLDSLVLIGANVFNGPDGQHRVNLSYEVRGPNGYVVTNVSRRNSLVDGFSARPMAESLQTTHAFSLDGRGSIHFLWLALMFVMPAACLSAAVVVGRTVGMPRRWLWVFVCLLAAPVFALNWTSGAWELRPLSITVLGSGFVRASDAAPWILSFGLPAGAALALWRRARWKERSVEPPDSAAV
jgi:hypothetical protein